jgi:hypothetical protein
MCLPIAPKTPIQPKSTRSFFQQHRHRSTHRTAPVSCPHRHPLSSKRQNVHPPGSTGRASPASYELLRCYTCFSRHGFLPLVLWRHHRIPLGIHSIPSDQCNHHHWSGQDPQLLNQGNYSRIPQSGRYPRMSQYDVPWEQVWTKIYHPHGRSYRSRGYLPAVRCFQSGAIDRLARYVFRFQTATADR